MTRRIKWDAVLLAGCLVATHASVQAQMAFVGQFAVNPSGAATYNIPIQLPPGLSGMGPKLGFSYNSQGGNGLLGVGWSLSGLSSIGRCPQTKLQDGVSGVVNYDLNDRYCLDGNRLIAVQGTDGANGTEYRLETEDFSKIISYAETGATGGPGSFVVKTKSGLTMEYGKSADSRVEAQGKTVVITWALNKVTDVSGNYYAIIYGENNSLGQHYPSKIEYVKNTIAASAVAPYSINFDYEERPDTDVSYYKDSVSKSLLRLSKVRVVAGSNTTAMTSYSLTYSASLSTRRTLLSQITQCTSSCLPALSFAYDESKLQVNSWVSGGHGIGDSGWQFVDLFGDGRPVYWTHSRNGQHYATRFNADGTYQNWTWNGAHGVGSDGWKFANLFGDGRMVYWTHSGSTHYATRLNPDGTFQNWTWYGAHGVGDKGWDTADLFGEGREVYYTHSSSGQHYVTRFNTDGTFQNITWNGGHGVGDGGWRLVDLFGEGRKVYWSRQGITHMVTRLNPDGTLQNLAYTGQGIGNGGSDFQDLFGDGRQVYWTRNNTTHYANRMNADGTVDNWSWAGQGIGEGGARFVDLYGDGRKAYWTRSGATHYVSRFNPDGTVQNVAWTGQGGGSIGWNFGNTFGDGREVYWTFSTNGGHFMTRFNVDGTVDNYAFNGHTNGSDGWQFVDVFGDGRQAYWTHSGANHFFTQFTAGQPDILKSVSDGLGGVISIGSDRLTKMAASSYIRDIASVYPRVNLAVPSIVTTSVSSSNGVGGTRSTQYSYANLLNETGLAGRGLLGFQWMQTKDVSTGLLSRTYYRQDFPYIGMVDKVGRGTSEASWSNLGSTTNEYKFMAFVATDTGYASGVTCSDDPATGKTVASCATSAIKPQSRYVPYASKVVSKAWDWDSTTNVFTALPQSRTSTVLDSWGNATQVKAETLNTDGTDSGYSKTTNSTFAPADTANWRLGRLGKSSVTATAP